MKYNLLVGVHGVGKTTLMDKIKTKIEVIPLSVSDLIRDAGNNIRSEEKHTKNISNNQELWKHELKKYTFHSDDIVILDGHFTLLNEKEEIIELPFSTFDNISIGKVILKSEEPSIIKERLQKRDEKIWSEKLITRFQNSEVKKAYQFSEFREIPIFEFKSESQLNELIQFLLK